MPGSLRKKNVLILGASGGVANAFLNILAKNRQIIGDLVLLDKKPTVLKNPIHRSLKNFKFIQYQVNIDREKKQYQKILLDNQIDIVIDISDEETLPIIKATNEVGVSIIDTGLNSSVELSLAENFLKNFYPHQNDLKNAPHIVFSGMNPGVVNMWVEYGIRKFGVPNEIVHFEYDTSMTRKWQPLVTWSIKEFLEECLDDPAGIMAGQAKLKEFFPNSLAHLEDMKNILEPIMKLRKYPSGMYALHEENMSIALKYHIPSRFVYSVHLKTMEYLIELDKQRKIIDSDLILGDNIKNKLIGADSIGVILEYDDKKVYYYNSLKNSQVTKKNATYTQVVTGVYAALFTLLWNNLEKGVHFVEDLYDTPYKDFIFSSLKIEEFVFSKNNHSLKLLSHNPKITLNNFDKLELFPQHIFAN